jgi:hypothetical protein
MYITVLVCTVPESTVHWKVIQCSCHCQYAHSVGHSTSLPNEVNVLLISVLDLAVFCTEASFSSALEEGRCSTDIHNSRYLVCVPCRTPVLNGEEFRKYTSLFISIQFYNIF